MNTYVHTRARYIHTHPRTRTLPSQAKLSGVDITYTPAQFTFIHTRAHTHFPAQFIFIHARAHTHFLSGEVVGCRRRAHIRTRSIYSYTHTHTHMRAHTHMHTHTLSQGKLSGVDAVHTHTLAKYVHAPTRAHTHSL